MKLKDILLASTLFWSSLAFGQDKLHFEIATKVEKSIVPKIMSHLNVSSDKVDFSFLWGLYSMEFQKINNFTYRETLKDETYEYAFKDSCYTLIDYNRSKGKPKAEKEILEGRTFDKKYKSLSDLFNDIKKGNLGDSLHFIVLGNPYSAKIEKIQNGKDLVYSCSLTDIIKLEPGDEFHFSYPIKMHAIKKNGDITPLSFSTKCLHVKWGKIISIEGKLKED